MSRMLFSALSAITLVGGIIPPIQGTAVYYLWKNVASGNELELVDRRLIRRILITLRKRVFSTLREISFIVNNIRTLEGDLESRKIS